MIAINVGFYLGYKKLRQVSRENFPRLIKPTQLFAAEHCSNFLQLLFEQTYPLMPGSSVNLPHQVNLTACCHI
jgi:hypothetical protein